MLLISSSTNRWEIALTRLKFNNFLVMRHQIKKALDDIGSNGDDSTQGIILITHFYQAVSSEKIPDPEVMVFLADAFKRIINKHYSEEKIDFARELRMKPPQNRPKRQKQKRLELSNLYGSFVDDLMEAGLSQNQAVSKASEEFKRHERTIRRYLAEYRKYLS